MIFEGEEFVIRLLVEHLSPDWEGSDAADVAAYCGGVLYNPSVHRILSKHASPKKCRCCMHTPKQSREELAAALAMAIIYITPRFRESQVYARLRTSFTTPLRIPEGDGAKRPRGVVSPPGLAEWRDAWDACTEVGVYFGYCDHGDHWWFYETPRVRKFLRALSRDIGQKGGKLQVRHPRPEEYLALPVPAAIKVVVFHGKSGKEARDALELFARQWSNPA